MTRRTLSLSIAAAVIGAGLALGVARAGDEPKPGGMPGMPALQKPVKHPFLDALVGSWTTESKSAMFGDKKGTAEIKLGVGGTCLIEDHASGKPGEKHDYFGHGIYKVSDDGKTLSCWWIDVHSTEPLKFEGPLTEKSAAITATTPQGELTLTFTKTADGVEIKMGMGGMDAMTTTWKRAAATK